jgi:D-lactate dehydrogenase
MYRPNYCMERVAWFDAKEWEKKYLKDKEHDFEIDFFKEPLNEDNAGKAEGYNTVSVFVDSDVNQAVIDEIDAEFIAGRSTGIDHIDTDYAAKKSVMVANVSGYGPSTVAEHTFGMLLDLTRKITAAQEHTENGDFSNEALRGTDLKGKKLGVIGTGKIGERAIEIAKGFQMEVIAYDPYPRDGLEHELGFMYVDLEDLLKQSDIITIHCPLTDDNHHLLSEKEFDLMDETILLNSARGKLVDTEALIEALKDGKVSQAGLDVLEEEYKDSSELLEREDTLITPHNAFNSKEALHRICDTTLKNIEERENVVNTPWG